MDYPKLRNIDIIPVHFNNKDIICLKDPLKIAPKMLFISPDTLSILRFMDGKHSLRDLQVEYMRNFGNLLFMEDIEKVVSQLDENYLLDNDNFNHYYKKIKEDFLKSDIRKAVFSGESYPEDPFELSFKIEEFFKGELPQSKEGQYVKGIIAPHIDFARGGNCYASAYKEVVKTKPAETFIILGTSHHPSNNLFILTKKDFSTPFGIVKNERGLTDPLIDKIGKELLEDEFIHRFEHTIEFQLIFLQYIMKDIPFTIIPILCGGFEEFIQSGKNVLEDEKFNRFIDVLKELIMKSKKKITIIASADLSHRGMQFGDNFYISPMILEETKFLDLKMLEFVKSGDAFGFYKAITEDKNSRNVCGVPPITTMLALLSGQKGELLDYKQWYDPNGIAMVSFASMIFY